MTRWVISSYNEHQGFFLRVHEVTDENETQAIKNCYDVIGYYELVDENNKSYNYDVYNYENNGVFVAILANVD